MEWTVYQNSDVILEQKYSQVLHNPIYEQNEDLSWRYRHSSAIGDAAKNLVKINLWHEGTQRVTPIWGHAKPF